MSTHAQLFISPHTPAVKHIETLLQKNLCSTGGCTTCTTCKKIVGRQHHAILWLHPEKKYTREQLEPIFKTISFTLEPGKKFFFVIQKADFLTAACANSLLKSVEEPPPGYHFFFVAEREQQVLPTIRSRCVIHTLYAEKKIEDQKILAIFKREEHCTPIEFDKLLWQKKPSQQETVELLDQLLHHWIEQHKKKKERADSQTITLLKNALLNPPMPGSSTIFWRNLYLHMNTI